MKRTQASRFKFVLPIIGVFSFVLVLKNGHADEPAKQPILSDETVVFNGPPMPSDGYLTPVFLASAIEIHPKARRFRTDWQYSVGGGSGVGAVLYNRKLRQLNYYERNFDSSGVSTFLYTYHGVTDESIQTLRADMGNPSNRLAMPRNNSGFDALSKKGVRRTGSWRYRTWSATDNESR